MTFLKKYWQLTLFIIAVLSLSGYFFYQSQQEPDLNITGAEVKTPETPTAKAPVGDTSQGGHWHGDEWHAESHTLLTEDDSTPPAVAQETSSEDSNAMLSKSRASVSETAQKSSTLPPLPPSSVPDDIPEHLKFPPELKGANYRTRPLSSEEEHRLQNIFKEIVKDYNPRRSRAKVWPQFIAAEKVYRAHGKWELGRTLRGTMSGDRYDWQYEQAWAFPEIIECFVAESDIDKFRNYAEAFYIGMGDSSPDDNLHILLDGREFRMRYNNKYVFKYYYSDAYTRTIRDEAAHAMGEPRPEVVIDVLNTSDVELERLGGWDFRINPITLQPF